MRKTLAILIGKLVIVLGKILNKGSSLPGQIALKICPTLTKKFILPKTVIAVTGSSGKGSTSSIIANVCRKLGFSVVHNSSGANLTPGITTTLIENCSLSGKIKGDIFIYEMDERFAKFVFPDIPPKHVVITNITKDQPPRQAHVDVIYNEIKNALPKNCHLILNGDDPYLLKFNLANEYDVTYYSLDKTDLSYTNEKFTNLNLYYCPKCGSKLEYNYYHFEALGGYNCTKCSFKLPESEFHITDVDYKNFAITVNNLYSIKIQYDLLYSVYNTMAAFTTACVLGLDPVKVASAISELNGNAKMYNNYKYLDKNVYVLNNKNENSTTFNQSLLFTERFEGTKTIVIGWKEISRRYNFDDLSWLYDIDFELLNTNDVNNIVCIGPNAYDIATRVKYAGIFQNKIRTFDSITDSTEFIDNLESEYIFAILNFDYVKPFKTIFTNKEGIK